MQVRRWVAATTAVLAVGGALGAPAFAAAQGDDGGSVPVVSWDQPCSTPGATGVAKSGKKLVCEQRPGVDDCPRWHDPAPGRPGPGWVWPSTSPCPLCASPSPAASSPSASTPSTSSSTPVASSPAPSWSAVTGLPVTG